MTLSSTATQGYPLLEGWTFSITAGGQTGTKVFLVGATLPDATLEDCPKIGDSWNADFLDVTCKSITKTYLPGCEDASKWTCTFDTVPTGQVSVALSADDLLRSVDVGGEFMSFEPDKGSDSWTWDDTGTAVEQPIFRNLVQSNIRIPVIVSDFKKFYRQSFDFCGRINKDEFLGIPKGNVLYLGCNINEFKNSWGARRWRAELNFSVRSLGNATIDETGDNWQFVMNAKTGAWDMPLDPAGNPMYETADFTKLFDFSLGTDEELYPDLPAK